jgi:hypothetical protein
MDEWVTWLAATMAGISGEAGLCKCPVEIPLLLILTIKKKERVTLSHKFQKTLEEVANLIRTDDDWAIDSACWEFAVCKGCIPKAAAKDLTGITKGINGGILGLDSREQYYKKAMQLIA